MSLKAAMRNKSEQFKFFKDITDCSDFTDITSFIEFTDLKEFTYFIDFTDCTVFTSSTDFTDCIYLRLSLAHLMSAFQTCFSAQAVRCAPFHRTLGILFFWKQLSLAGYVVFCFQSIILPFLVGKYQQESMDVLISFFWCIYHSQSPNNGILKNNCCIIPFQTKGISQWTFIAAMTDSSTSQYEKIFVQQSWSNTGPYTAQRVYGPILGQLTKPPSY